MTDVLNLPYCVALCGSRQKLLASTCEGRCNFH